MVFVFQVGAEKTAEAKTTKQQGPDVLQKGELDHSLLLQLARRVVESPDVKQEPYYAKPSGSVKGREVGEVYIKKVQYFEIQVEVPKSMSIEDALKAKGVDVVIYRSGSLDGGCKNLTNAGGDIMLSNANLKRLTSPYKKTESNEIIKSNREEFSETLLSLDKMMGEFGPRK